MRYIFLIVAILPFIAFTQSESTNNLFISGSIEGEDFEPIMIISSAGNRTYQISVDTNGIYKDTLHLSSGEYSIVNGQQFFPLNVNNDLKVSILFEKDKLWSTSSFSGRDASYVKYHLDKFLLEMNLFEVMAMEKLYLLSEAKYIKRIDSITKLKKSLIDQYSSGLSAMFIEYESDDLKYWRLSTLNEYESGRKWIRKSQEYETSDQFPDIFQNVNFNESHLTYSKYYKSFLKSYFYSAIVENTSKNDSVKHDIELLKLTLEKVQDSALLSQLFIGYMNQEGKTTKNIEEFFNLLRKGIKDNNKLEELVVLEHQRKKTLPGATVANFSFNNQQGVNFELNDFLGSLVVIDVWASWCLPCLTDIPELEKAKNQFKNDSIVFIGINAMDKKGEWKSVLESKKMTGIQLFAPSTDDQFFKELMIESLPRYIFIDRQGKLINARLTRPSNKEFIEIIKKEL